jgi:tRNA-dihydrouridine synthase C
VPVMANGEVWTVDDYLRCRAVSGCDDVMIGRGAVADPFLARRIKAHLAGTGLAADSESEWCELRPLIGEFWRQVQGRVEARHAPGRLKLWLNSLRQKHAAAEALYLAVRPLRGIDECNRVFLLHGVPLGTACLPALV